MRPILRALPGGRVTNLPGENQQFLDRYAARSVGPENFEQNDSNLDVPPLVEVSNSDDESYSSTDESDSDSDDDEPRVTPVSALVRRETVTVSTALPTRYRAPLKPFPPRANRRQPTIAVARQSYPATTTSLHWFQRPLPNPTRQPILRRVRKAPTLGAVEQRTAMVGVIMSLQPTTTSPRWWKSPTAIATTAAAAMVGVTRSRRPTTTCPIWWTSPLVIATTIATVRPVRTATQTTKMAYRPRPAHRPPLRAPVTTLICSQGACRRRG